MLFRLSPLLLILVSWFVSAEQACQADSTIFNVNLGKVFVPNDAQPGDIIKVGINTVNITCGNVAHNQQITQATNAGWGRSGMTMHVNGLNCPVLDLGTGISDLGLGIVWTNYNSGAGTWGCMTSYFPSLNGAANRRGLRRNGTAVITDELYIVKTNKETAYGKEGVLSQSIHIGEADADNNVLGDLYTINFDGVLQASLGGCSMESQVNVSMGNVSTSTFHGVGSTGPNVPFSLTLKDCKGTASKVDLRLEPTYGYADKANGVISLDESEGAASGMGIQLLIDGKIIDSDEEAIKYPFRVGTTQIPFTARYYQISDTVKAGNADSMLVFYIYYE